MYFIPCNLLQNQSIFCSISKYIFFLTIVVNALLSGFVSITYCTSSLQKWLKKKKVISSSEDSTRKLHCELEFLYFLVSSRLLIFCFYGKSVKWQYCSESSQNSSVQKFALFWYPSLYKQKLQHDITFKYLLGTDIPRDRVQKTLWVSSSLKNCRRKKSTSKTGISDNHFQDEAAYKNMGYSCEEKLSFLVFIRKDVKSFCITL